MNKENKFDLDKVSSISKKFNEDDWRKLHKEIKETIEFIQNMNKIDKDIRNKEYTI